MCAILCIFAGNEAVFMKHLLESLHSGKNLKFPYYLKNVMRLVLPSFFCRLRLRKTLAQIEKRNDKDYIKDRVDYYCKLSSPVRLPESAPTVGRHRLKGNRSVYFFDTYEFTRWFPKWLRWSYVFGDVTRVPSVPSVVKSRPLCADNSYSVLLNLDKIRHFVFLKDRIPFTRKEDKIIFRGEAHGKKNRIDFINMYREHEMCDVGDVGYNPPIPHADGMTLYKHLRYKFIMALEGNDVASNLKWIMSTNSIAVMPRPTCETWFMEGRLIPDFHYIAIKSDYSDLISKVNYYIAHPEKAQEIIDHANEYVKQFRDKKRERLISLLVLDKYFRMTNAGNYPKEQQ